MKEKNDRLACTARGTVFVEWRDRPVYRVHCHTFAVARQLCGLPIAPGGLVTKYGGNDSFGLTTFRALKPYRTPESNELRGRVAVHIRRHRSERRAMEMQAS